MLCPTEAGTVAILPHAELPPRLPSPPLAPRGILATVGRTPLLRLERILGNHHAAVFVKAENRNPLASVKDRIGLAMVEAAEADGSLRPGGRIIEPTSGNTGIALAFVGASKGYDVTLTMPDSMSSERRALLLGLGAEFVLTPAATVCCLVTLDSTLSLPVVV